MVDENSVECRYARISGTTDSTPLCYTEGLLFDDLATASYSLPGSTVRNRIIFIPGLLTPDECQQLVCDVEARHAAAQDTALSDQEEEEEDEVLHNWGLFERHKIRDLSDETQRLFNTLLHERLLPFISKELPKVRDLIWEHSRTHSSMRCSEAPELSQQEFRFSQQEPCVNRYGVGGMFTPHTDQHALTLNLLLTVGTFEGGGTEFWNEDKHGMPTTEEQVVRVEPTVAGVGVLFNGTVKHAGRAVTAGLRHLLVASFSLANGSIDARDELDL